VAALTGLVLVFVIGIVEFAEAAVFEVVSTQRERQYAAKTSDLELARSVEITDPADAIQFRLPLSNVFALLGRQDSIGVNLFDGAIEANWQPLTIEPTDGFDCSLNGKGTFFFHNKIINAYFVQERWTGAVINARYIDGYWLLLPNIRFQNDMFDANSWTMGCEKFGAGEPKLEEIHSPQSSGSERKDTSKGHEPQRIKGDSLFGGLMPFFYGLGTGLLIVFGGGSLAWRLWGV
jgi:hypothetical protein